MCLSPIRLWRVYSENCLFAGDDGTDGNNGEDGTDGQNGENTDDFEVMFEFLSENLSKGTRKYKILHSGTKGKDEFVVKINLKSQLFLVLGKGGKGGNGYVVYGLDIFT